jgi:enediyne biosynthesis protein E4
VYESDGIIPSKEIATPKTLFKETTAQNKFNYSHKEDEFIDFKREPLIPYRCSRKGPYYTKADVNKDGREDIFIGGSAGSEGKLMMQNADGSFSEKKQAAFTADKNYEDAGVLFFDADGDNDYDLYAVSGGSEFEPGNILYQDRLYLNDGNGNFTRSARPLPKEMHNGSFVMPLDFDGDGDKDLFIGGGVLPGKFPKHDKNFLLQNYKGSFVDVTGQYIPQIDNSGIVNYSAWADIDNDGRNELVLAGEWMPLTLFKWIDNKFVRTDGRVTITLEEKKQRIVQLSDIKGWWNVVKIEDIDNDGDNDIIVGNRGMNSRITGKFGEPCTIYAKDFDNNGSYDAVLGFYTWGKLYPMFHRDALIDQMPSMRKKFVRYHDYAGKTLGEIFTDEQKSGMDIYTANFFESGVFVNEGQNGFRFESFPPMAQLSSINDIIIADLDKDGSKDILVCGNSYDPDITTGNLDAMASLFLKGQGNGQFTAVPSSLSGLPVQGEIRRIIPLEGSSFIFLQNNAKARIFSLN